MTTAISLDGTTRRDGAAFEYQLEVGQGDHVVVAGPNGSGKSTLLRVLSGLLPLTDGRLELSGHVVDQPGAATFVPPERRGVVLQPQSGALFEHLDVRDNVAFALRTSGQDRRQARRSAEPWMDLLDLRGLARRAPASLSGGQRSRVALARSLASEPDVLLLDEPAAALDAVARADLRQVIHDLEPTVLTVTHDPIEARLLGSVIIVVHDHAVAQVGTAEEIAARPGTPWVAEMLGLNLVSGIAERGRVELPGGASVTLAEPRSGPVHVSFPSNAVVLHRERPQGSARNVWDVTVAGLSDDHGRVRVALTGSVDVSAVVTSAAAIELGLAPGSRCWASVKATELNVLPGWEGR